VTIFLICFDNGETRVDIPGAFMQADDERHALKNIEEKMKFTKN